MSRPMLYQSNYLLFCFLRKWEIKVSRLLKDLIIIIIVNAKERVNLCLIVAYMTGGILLPDNFKCVLDAMNN